jgi:hypothetical protein
VKLFSYLHLLNDKKPWKYLQGPCMPSFCDYHKNNIRFVLKNKTFVCFGRMPGNQIPKLLHIEEQKMPGTSDEMMESTFLILVT